MAKKFNIHEWQANQWLKNQLNEVDIKKVVDQSMNNDDIGKLMDVIRNNDLGKTLNTIAVIVDQTGGMPQGAAQMIADLVPKIVPDEEEFTPDLEDDELKRGAIQQMMAKEKDIDENMTGTGASFSAGNSMAHMGKSKKKRANTPSGDMAYTQNINEQEEVDPDFLGSDGQIEPDVEKIGAMIGTKINTGEEWVELFHMLMAQSSEINQLTSTEIKQLLINYSKEI